MSIGRVQHHFGAPSHSRKGIAAIQSNPTDRDARVATRGGQLSICRLDYSASPFQNVFFLCEEIFCVSFNHHCHPGTFWQLEEPPSLSSLNLPNFFGLLASGKWVTITLHMKQISRQWGCVFCHTAGSSASYTADLVHTNDSKTSNKAEMMSLSAKEIWLQREKT